MRIERRFRPSTELHDVVIVAETPAESEILDLLGSNVGEDGLIVTGAYELRLSDGVGDHYVLLKNPRQGRVEIDWSEIPCGHPPDPLASSTPEGFVCHCGQLLVSGGDAIFGRFPGMIRREGNLAIVPCSGCGCHVGIPAE